MRELGNVGMRECENERMKACGNEEMREWMLLSKATAISNIP